MSLAIFVRSACTLLLVFAAAGSAAAQPAARTAATTAALGRYPLFFHGKQVVVRGTASSPADGVVTLRTGEGDRPVFLLRRGGTVDADGPVEVRGEFWDLGRLNEDDPRIAGADVQRLIDRVSEGRWPPQGQAPVILVQSAGPAERLAEGLRALALEPSRFEGRRLTVTGRFRGANLHGDLPQSPGKSRYDFVLQSADASIWVTGARPRGRGFNLDPSRRVDTGKPLEVTGTARTDGALVWIEATAIRPGPESVPAAVVEVPTPAPGPPPAVAFSIPVHDETDVSPGVAVRIQFTRDMTPGSFAGRVAVSYVDRDGDGQLPVPSATYRRENRVLEIAFDRPFERFRTVRIDLKEGITATDGVPLAPWSLTFSIGTGP